MIWSYQCWLVIKIEVRHHSKLSSFCKINKTSFLSCFPVGELWMVHNKPKRSPFFLSLKDLGEIYCM